MERKRCLVLKKTLIQLHSSHSSYANVAFTSGKQLAIVKKCNVHQGGMAG